jgi:hypothetical protein
MLTQSSLNFVLAPGRGSGVSVWLDSYRWASATCGRSFMSTSRSVMESGRINLGKRLITANGNERQRRSHQR